MARIHLTDRTLRSLETSLPREDFLDDSLEDFGVRVSGDTGRRTFFVRYRANGKRRRVTLGRYPILSLADARDRAKAVLFDVIQGNDPAADIYSRRVAETFGELAELYLERHAKPNKAPTSYREDKRQLDKDLLPAWKDRKAAEISRGAVLDLLDSIMDRGAPVMANRTLALISRVFTFGIERGVVESNPAYRVKPPSKERSRQRVLSEEEIKAFWKALAGQTPLMAATFKLRLLTAQRGIEVLSMRKVDLDGSWWTVPAEVSKTGEAHRVPLSPQAMAVLAAEGLSGQLEWVFPSPRARGGHLLSVQKAAAEIRTAAGFHFTPHDLRRTTATHIARLGVSRFIIGRILNHAERGITSIYDRASYDTEKRKALDAWGEKVEAIVSTEEGA